jgi:hypothetical protein
LEARKVETPEPASLSIGLPILIAAADESRDELQDIWARLLAAAADPSRSKAFRIAFIETAKKMDPLDAAVLAKAYERNGRINSAARNEITSASGMSADEVYVSIANLVKLDLLAIPNPPDAVANAFGREFLRALND